MNIFKSLWLKFFDPASEWAEPKKVVVQPKVNHIPDVGKKVEPAAIKPSPIRESIAVDATPLLPVENLERMTTGQQQRVFVRMVADLIIFAYNNGYELSFGDASRMDKRGHKHNSKHYVRLAIDLNLFKDGEWLKKTEDHAALGRYWEMLGGIWGGRFNDGNHYQLGKG